jgi:hypothetical protein
MLATQGSERLALFTLATTVVGTLATAFFYWLQTQLEVNRKAAEEAGKKAEEAGKKAEEAAKEAGKKSEEAGKKAEEAGKKSEEAGKKAEEAAKEAGKKAEEAAKEAGKKSEDIMDLIRNEHRESIRDNKFSNRFAVLFPLVTLGVSWLSSLVAGLQLR